MAAHRTDPTSDAGRFGISRRSFLAAGAAAAVVGVPGTVAARSRPERPRTTDPSTATDWIRTLYGVVMAEGLTPPAAARFYHYVALAMYESTLPAMPRHRSLAGQLQGLGAGPRSWGPIDPVVALSTAVDSVSTGLLPNGLEASHTTIADHHAHLLAARRPLIPRTLFNRSTAHGARVAGHLQTWIAADGYAEAAMLPYSPPTGPDMWRSTPPNFGTAIEPHWAKVRPAVLHSPDEVAPEPHLPFSIEVGSPFHEQAMATYRQSFVNTEDQIAIARFWTDNPRLSGLPSGHWFVLLAQLAHEPLGLGLADAVEGFARLGVALHDAFTNCWTWKYRYNLIRPVSFVQDHIDPTWSTIVNTPQFPEYTSGHSVGSGAADVVLTDLYGSFPFTDSTGIDRQLAPRSFASFSDAAAEAARSRIYGGIHYPMAIEHGVAQGREIGDLVVQRLRTRR